ncbi:PRD domain-containing protein [Clostridium sp.]|uniref:PRD domain-containing protein n=1 Tax=Clostridium sp. TaxID=1506 RepID=UPI0025C1D2F3|nr:PRD domain-containing protein [Clostridium sp.]
MKIIKLFNNNIVATVTEDNREVLVQGAGIGFKKKIGDLIDEDKIEKKYFIEADDKSIFNEILDKIPIEYFQISEEIIEIASSELEVKLSSQLILALTDHIFCAVERFKEDVILPNLMSSEIRILYSEEYKIGLRALDVIEKYIGERLPVDEASYIAIHIVNACLDLGTSSTRKILVLCSGVSRILKEIYNIDLTEDRFDYSRLTTHLKFLAQRIITNSMQNIDGVDDLYDLLKKKDSKLEICVDKVGEYIKKTFDYEILKQEKVYLMVHLLKVIRD